MDLTLSRNFNQNEKIAALKLMIKIASSDGEISESEKASLGEYLKHTKLKTNENFIKNVIIEDIGQIVSVFESKIHLQRVQKLARAYAEKHGVDPDFEGALLAVIDESVAAEKKNKKLSIKKKIKDIFLEFGYLWGKDDVNPKTRQLLAIVFTLCACVFAAFSTTNHFFTKDTTNFIHPGFTGSILGILIFSALSVRRYLPKPTNFKNIIFSAANVCLLSYIAKHIVGSGIEQSLTIYILFSLIILLWLGIKEIIGFVFLGFFILCGYKIMAIDTHLAWRALPFIFSAFIGIGFQSSNFFDDFGNLANSIYKRSNVDKELLKESIEIAGQQTKRTAQAAVQTGVTAAKLSAGAV